MANPLRRVSDYVAHVGLLRAVGLIGYRWIGKFLCPGAVLTWGDLGEDALIWFYFSEVLRFRGPGFFVDVGCNHPIRLSNTFRLYQMGWHGIAIDADADVTLHYARTRPRDKAVTALVSDQAVSMDFHVFEGTVISSAVPEQVEAWKKSGRNVTSTRTMRSETLSAILERLNAPTEFELLKIDVEGHDASVLRSIDLVKYRPRMIVIEMHLASLNAVFDTEIYQRLAGHGYTMTSLAGYNGIFLRDGA